MSSTASTVGKRNLTLNGEAVEVAARLLVHPSLTARWIGRDAHRELTSPAVQARLRRGMTKRQPRSHTER